MEPAVTDEADEASGNRQVMHRGNAVDAAAPAAGKAATNAAARALDEATASSAGLQWCQILQAG